MARPRCTYRAEEHANRPAPSNERKGLAARLLGGDLTQAEANARAHAAEDAAACAARQCLSEARRAAKHDQPEGRSAQQNGHDSYRADAIDGMAPEPVAQKARKIVGGREQTGINTHLVRGDPLAHHHGRKREEQRDGDWFTDANDEQQDDECPRKWWVWRRRRHWAAAHGRGALARDARVLSCEPPARARAFPMLFGCSPRASVAAQRLRSKAPHAAAVASMRELMMLACPPLLPPRGGALLFYVCGARERLEFPRRRLRLRTVHGRSGGGASSH